MSRKVYNLVTGIIGGVEVIAIALVAFCNPAYAVVSASIVIVGTAAIEVCGQFVEK